jgi:hypothetical protein
MLVTTPKSRCGGRWYEITGQAAYGPLLAGVVDLVPPDGSEGAYTRQIRRFARAA